MEYSCIWVVERAWLIITQQSAMAKEMSSFSSSDNQSVTLWDLYERAAKLMYGDDIVVLKTTEILRKLKNMCFILSVESADQQITEKTRTVVDITHKEYINSSDKEADETIVQAHKRPVTVNKYHFRPQNGVNWGIQGDIGAKVRGLSMSGGCVIIGEVETSVWEESIIDKFVYDYDHEERVKIPPQTKVKVMVMTSAIKYEQNYTLRFSISSKFALSVKYKSYCNRLCCGITDGLVTAAQVFYSLPSYHEQNGKSIFYQQGTLCWMGEARNIEKNLEHTGRSEN